MIYDLNKSLKTTYSRYLDIPIIRFHKELFFSDEVLQESQKMQNSYLKIAKEHSKINAKEDIENIIIVIGESSRRSAFSVYGNVLNTSPFLKNIENKVVFSDVISPYPATNPTMSVLLNFANLENIKERKYYENLDIINLFKLSGYKTFWISNQDYISLYGNNAATIGLMSDFSFFANKNLNTDVISYVNYDEVLLPIIEQLELSNKNIIFIHIMGNHANYKKRYPKHFNLFKEEDIDNNLNSKQKQTIAQYYNSILYTDFILSKIYEIFKNKDSLMIYLSDHAEALWDDKTGLVVGHSIYDNVVLEIPFIFLYSNTFKQKHINLLNQIEKSKDLAFMSDDFIHLLCDIVKMDAKECEYERSLINSKYNKNRKRIFSNGIDYEKLKND